MATPTYDLIELVGVSDASEGDAVRAALRRADQTLEALNWFEVQEIRGAIVDGAVSEFQVALKVGFRLLPPTDGGR